MTKPTIRSSVIRPLALTKPTTKGLALPFGFKLAVTAAGNRGKAHGEKKLAKPATTARGKRESNSWSLFIKPRKIKYPKIPTTTRTITVKTNLNKLLDSLILPTILNLYGYLIKQESALKRFNVQI